MMSGEDRVEWRAGDRSQKADIRRQNAEVTPAVVEDSRIRGVKWGTLNKSEIR
jgi:hypothetical protein